MAPASPGSSFIGRYVFPDGELIDVGQVVLAMEAAGFEVRDVESLREHYSRTLHAWVENLHAHWRKRWPKSASDGPGSGSSIWRRRPMASMMEGCRSTRCSGSGPITLAAAGCHPRAWPGHEDGGRSHIR